MHLLSSRNGKLLFKKIDTFNVHDTITKSCFILFDKLLDFTGVNAFVIHGTISYFQGSQSRFFINTLEVFLIRLLEYYQEKFEYQRLVLLQRWILVAFIRNFNYSNNTYCYVYSCLLPCNLCLGAIQNAFQFQWSVGEPGVFILQFFLEKIFWIRVWNKKKLLANILFMFTRFVKPPLYCVCAFLLKYYL